MNINVNDEKRKKAQWITIKIMIHLNILISF